MSEFHVFESEALITLFLIPLLQTSPMCAGTSTLAAAGHHGSARRVCPPEKRLCLQGWFFQGRAEVRSLDDVSVLDPESFLPQM